MTDTILHSVTLRKTLPNGNKLSATASLHRIGNQSPYFSLTYEEEKAGGRFESGGAGHEYILKHWPQLAPIARLHLSDYNGKPMHTVDNGFYWAGGNKEWCKGQPSDPPNAEYLANHLRISLDHAKETVEDVASGRMNKLQFQEFCEAQEARWLIEASEGIALIQRLNVDKEESEAV
jgi:hypothetical protein